jgi:hypothetical protein
MANIRTFPWKRILIWAVVLGLLVSMLADWGDWERLPQNTLLRVMVVALGAIGGWLLDSFFGNYVSLGTHVIESMGIFKFTNEAQAKITNGFIFVVAFVAAILAMLLIQ